MLRSTDNEPESAGTFTLKSIRINKAANFKPANGSVFTQSCSVFQGLFNHISQVYVRHETELFSRKQLIMKINDVINKDRAIVFMSCMSVDSG